MYTTYHIINLYLVLSTVNQYLVEQLDEDVILRNFVVLLFCEKLFCNGSQWGLSFCDENLWNCSFETFGGFIFVVGDL